jgi:hypothetical protein
MYSQYLTGHSGSGSDFCSRGARFLSWPKHRLSLLRRFVVFLSVPPDKCQDTTANLATATSFHVLSTSVRVVTVTTLRDGRFGVRIPADARDFLFTKTVQTGSWAHTASCSVGAGFFFFAGVKRPGCEFNHSLPFTAECKDECGYIGTFPVCLSGVHWENFTLCTLISSVLTHHPHIRRCVVWHTDVFVI